MISVLIPTYNNAVFLGQAIKSVLNQTFSEFEVLILDDGSTDQTETVVRNIHDARLIYHRLPHQGLTKTLNEGLSRAKHDIIARMDADDLCVPWRFKKQLSVLKQLSRKTILSSWYAIFSDDEVDYCVRTPTTSDEIKNGLLLHSYISHPGVMCYRDVLERNGGYCTNVDVDAFQDYETWLKIKDQADFSIIPEILMFQRYRKESLSNNIRYKQRIMYLIQEPYYADLQSHFGISNRVVENLFRGWREYFYGSKAEARTYWAKLGFMMIHHPRTLIAWIVTLLPEDYFVVFKEGRVRYHVEYFLRYYGNEMRRLRKVLKILLKQ
jgi:glycosyltransferase involved in cell wall biosynthesis